MFVVISEGLAYGAGWKNMSYNNSSSNLKLIIGILSVVAMAALGITLFVLSVQFDRGCGGHLKRAADANSIELAEKELQLAVDYMEANGLTSGYTSIIYQTPDEDIGFWYGNIESSLSGLKSTPDTATSLEKSNVLIKLRETLIDHGSSGDSITIPSGISLYPNNRVFALLWVVFIAVLLAVIPWRDLLDDLNY